MNKLTPPLTPECDKWGKHRDSISDIYDFIDYMNHIQGAQFAKTHMKTCWKCNGDKTIGDFNELVCPECNGAGEVTTEHLYPVTWSLNDLLCDFYAIDQGKLEKERRTLLEYQRELNNTLSQKVNINE